MRRATVNKYSLTIKVLNSNSVKKRQIVRQVEVERSKYTFTLIDRGEGRAGGEVKIKETN